MHWPWLEITAVHRDKLHIVIVDDDPVVALLLSAVLRQALGAKVSVGASVAEARVLLSYDPAPDLAILDYQLGATETSLDLVAWIRNQPHLSNTRLVSLSSTPPDVIRARSNGWFSAFFTKPAPVAEFVQQLAMLLQSGATSDELSSKKG